MSANGKRKPSFLSQDEEEEDDAGGGGGGRDHGGGVGKASPIDSLGKDLADDDEFPIDLKVETNTQKSQQQRETFRDVLSLANCNPCANAVQINDINRFTDGPFPTAESRRKIRGYKAVATCTGWSIWTMTIFC